MYLSSWFWNVFNSNKSSWRCAVSEVRVTWRVKGHLNFCWMNEWETFHTIHFTLYWMCQKLKINDNHQKSLGDNVLVWIMMTGKRTVIKSLYEMLSHPHSHGTYMNCLLYIWISIQVVLHFYTRLPNSYNLNFPEWHLQDRFKTANSSNMIKVNNLYNRSASGQF